MAQNHNADFTEKPMTTYGRTQSPSRRYRRLRHPTFPAAEWASKNPLLQRGEIGVESDTHKVKVGDGLTYWNSLQYITADAEGQQKSTADYSMGNSSGGWTVMSTAQQDALNSGATTTNITQIGTNTTSIGNHIADTANPHQVTASQVGLGNVDNTSDADKPISTATQSALDGKQDTLTAGTNINITGSTISATDTTYTGSDGVTLTGTNFTNSGVRSVSSGTTNGTISVNTNGTSADVSVTGLGSAAYTNSSAYATAAQGTKADTAVQPGDLATVATTGSYTDLLNKPTIPAAQVNSDWNANSGVEQILNKPTLGTAASANTTDFATAAQGALADTAVQPGNLATVATSGSYNDLLNKPTIPTVNNPTITITQGGVTKGSFTLNQTSGDTIALDAGASFDAGMLASFATATAPTGWLICDGSAVSRTDYADLFAAIGTTYGPGDGSTTFNLPDFSGARILNNNNSDVIDGGNTLVSPKWYNNGGGTFSAGHTMALFGQGGGSGYFSGTANPDGTCYTKLQVDLTNQPSILMCIKY